MEAVEFIRKIQKMCTGTKCDVCPLRDKNGCNVCYAEDPVESVRIVEEWAKEHPEEAEQEQQKPERERQKPEQKRQNPEQERKKAELHDKTYALREKVDHTPTKEASQTPEPKRTNKDVLLAVLPNVDTSACPKVLDMNYKCDKRKLCAVCKHEFWNEEVEK